MHFQQSRVKIEALGDGDRCPDALFKVCFVDDCAIVLAKVSKVPVGASLNSLDLYAFSPCKPIDVNLYSFARATAKSSFW